MKAETYKTTDMFKDRTIKRVLTYSSYVPEPWVQAHGCELVRIRPRGTTIHESVGRLEGLCPFTQAWVSDVLLGMQADGIVLTTCCDQMRRAFELVEQISDTRCFLFNLPKVWQSEGAFESYKNELQRLGRFLDSLEHTGIYPDQQPMSAECNPDLISLALVGSHGMTHDDQLKHWIERAGGTIAVDTTSPECDWPEETLTFEVMARTAWDHIQDVFQRPNTKLYERLSRTLTQNPVKGIVLRRYVWCDLWHGEVERIKAWSPVPVLDIEVSRPDHMDRHRLINRIQAFMEMIG